MSASQQNWIRTLQNSLTVRILSTSVLIFACYFTIGLQLAVVPGFVHLQLGYNAVLAGLAISVQYVATLLSRPIAGRMSDSVGAKRTTCSGLLVCAASGLFFLWSSSLTHDPSDKLLPAATEPTDSRFRRKLGRDRGNHLGHRPCRRGFYRSSYFMEWHRLVRRPSRRSSHGSLARKQLRPRCDRCCQLLHHSRWIFRSHRHCYRSDPPRKRLGIQTSAEKSFAVRTKSHSRRRRIRHNRIFHYALLCQPTLAKRGIVAQSLRHRVRDSAASIRRHDQ
jgi:hypothetical protein